MVAFYADPTLLKHHNHAFETVPPPPLDDALPPGMDAKTFESVLSQLRDIVGEENVAVGDQLRYFRDPYPLTIYEYQPSAAVWSASSCPPRKAVTDW